MLSRQWLNAAYPLRTTCDKVDGHVINEYWDCGARVDPNVGITRCRVLELGPDAFGLEVGQSINESEIKWPAAVFIPVSTPAELITIVDALLSKNRV